MTTILKRNVLFCYNSLRASSAANLITRKLGVSIDAREGLDSNRLKLTIPRNMYTANSLALALDCIAAVSSYSID